MRTAMFFEIFSATMGWHESARSSAWWVIDFRVSLCLWRRTIQDRSISSQWLGRGW